MSGHLDSDKDLGINRSIFENSLDAILITKLEGSILAANPMAEKMFGMTEDELKAAGRDGIVVQVENLKSTLKERTQNGRFKAEITFKRQDGTTFPGEITSTIFKDNNGNDRTNMTIRDLSDLKYAEKLLLDSMNQNRLLSDLLESSMQPFAVGYPDGSLGYFNKAFEELTGYTKQELKESDWMQILTPPKFHEMEQQKLEELQHTGQSVRYQKEYIRKDGTRIPIELFVHLIRKEDGTPNYYYSFITDITERKKVENSLKEKEEKYHSLYSSMHEGVAIHEIIYNSHQEAVDYLITDINPAYEHITGLNRREVLGKKASELYGTNDPPYIEIYASVAKSGEATQFETYFEPMDKYFSISVTSPEKGKFNTVFEDITKSKKTERDLKRQAALLDVSYEAIFSWDYDGGILSWNQGAEKLYGYKSKEAIGSISHNLLKTEFPLEFNEFMENLANEKIWNGELIHTTKKRNKIIVESSMQLIQDTSDKMIVIETNRDISERKKTENALRESEERFRDLAENIPNLAWMAEANGWIFWYNKQWYDYTGTTLEEMQGWGWQKVHHPDYVQAVTEEWSTKIKEAKPYDNIFPLRGKNGNYRWFLTRVTPIKDKQGKLLRWFGTNTDITERKQTEEKLLESETRFRSVFNNSLDVIYRFNLQTGRYEYMSPAIRGLGFEPEEMMAMSDDEVISRVHPDDRPALLSVLSQINQTGKGIAEYRFLGNSDKYRWWSNQMVIIKDSAGKPLYRDGSVRDITKRKQAEIKLKETLNNLEELVQERTKDLLVANDYNRNLIETSLDPLVTIGPNGKITDVNRATEEVTGYSREEIVDTDFADYFTNPGKAKEGYKQVFQQGEVRDYPLQIKHKYGSTTPVLYNASVYKDESGDVVGVFAAARDITERQKAEDAFRVYWESLEEQVKQRTEELAKSNADLKQFAYVASHDLREPLRMISSFLQLLERRYKDQLDEDANEFIGFAVDGAKRLDSMIMDLLEYSRVANKEMKFTNIDLEEVIDQIKSNLNVLIRENNAQITYDSLPTIHSDQNQMIILLQNLISNAIKYRRDETPQIHVSAEKEANQYVFSVKDNGIGIKPQHLERIFTIFQRLHNRDEYEGTGIGLSIAQRIVHQHGGEIWAESELGKSSTFYFTIPETH